MLDWLGSVQIRRRSESRVELDLTLGTAIGCAGLKPLRDRRGEHDLFGRELQAMPELVGVVLGAAMSKLVTLLKLPPIIAGMTLNAPS